MAGRVRGRVDVMTPLGGIAQRLYEAGDLSEKQFKRLLLHDYDRELVRRVREAAAILDPEARRSALTNVLGLG